MVRLRFSGAVFGIAGDGTLVVDRWTGRYVLHLDAGPAGESEGFDGTHAWRADASGMPRIEGNLDQRAAMVDFAHVLSPAGGNGRLISKRADSPSELLECAGIGSRPVRITLDPGNGYVRELEQHVGANVTRTSFDDYRSVDGVVVPYSIKRSDDNGTWEAKVNDVTTGGAPAPDELAPPPVPRDSELESGPNAVALAVPVHYPIVSVTVNGVRLRFILDTGGQNVITPAAAKRIGAQAVGGGTVGGAGAGLASIRYAWIDRMQVGPALMRHQAFIVLSLGKLVDGVDGIVGYELLARFATRLDFVHATLTFYRDAPATAGETIVPMRFLDRQPEIDASLDGLSGAMSIDTGSSGSIDVNSPFAQSHRLAYRYPLQVRGMTYAGVGGAVSAEFVRGHELRIGNLSLAGPLVSITAATGGFESDPTVAANIGDTVLHHFTITFDYPHQQIAFVADGLRGPDQWPDKSGIALEQSDGKLVVGSVLSPTPASAAGQRPGDRIVIADGAVFTSADEAAHVRLFDGPDGSVVRLVIRRNGERRHVDLVLHTYL